MEGPSGVIGSCAGRGEPPDPALPGGILGGCGHSYPAPRNPSSSRPRLVWRDSGAVRRGPRSPPDPHQSTRPFVSESPVWARERSPIYGMRPGAPRYYNLVVVEPGALIPLLRRPGFPIGFARSNIPGNREPSARPVASFPEVFTPASLRDLRPATKKGLLRSVRDPN